MYVNAGISHSGPLFNSPTPTPKITAILKSATKCPKRSKCSAITLFLCLDVRLVFLNYFAQSSSYPEGGSSADEGINHIRRKYVKVPLMKFIFFLVSVLVHSVEQHRQLGLFQGYHNCNFVYSCSLIKVCSRFHRCLYATMNWPPSI